jgi:hypothetical protein
MRTMPDYPQKITFGELRASGVRRVLVYCRDHKCSHHVEVSADRWPDQIRLSDIEPGRDDVEDGGQRTCRPKMTMPANPEIPSGIDRRYTAANLALALELRLDRINDSRADGS